MIVINFEAKDFPAGAVAASWTARSEQMKKIAKQKRLYISGAITGTPDARERFERVAEEYTARGYTVLNPQKMCAELPELEHAEYMTLCFQLIDMCEYFHAMTGWENSRGANQEYGYALAKGKRFI